MSQEQNEAEKLVGRLLANTYRLEQLLVSGGMGAVFRARHVRTGGAFAVKVLHERSAANAEIYERFLDEARIIATLKHPGIVQVMDLDQDASGLAFIVMELLEGEDLQDLIDRQGQIPLPRALEITRQVSSALYAAHQKGVIHRDLKPRNIFLAREEHNGHLVENAKVIDFGVSKIPRPADRATRDLLVLGTPRYMAPEGALGQNSQIDPRSDQWSVAVILYRMVSGKLPFDTENIIDLFKMVVNDEPTPLEQLVPGLPPYIGAAIRRALAKKKEDRFPTMVEFVAALEAPPKKRKKSADAPPPPTPQFAWKRSLVFAGLGALAAGLLLLPALKSRLGGVRKTGNQATDLLQQADIDLLEERWDEAAARAAQVLSLPGQPETVRAQAAMTQKRADNGRQAQTVYLQIQAAIDQKDYDKALRINRELPPRIGFKLTAQQHYDLLVPLVIGMHLQKAEAARTAGDCGEVQNHLGQILAIEPQHEGALQSRWRPCASFATATPPGHYKLAGYPPVRDQGTGGPELPGDYPGGRTSLADIDRFLREGQLAFQSGQYMRALTLAHAAAGVSVRSQTAWRIISISACALKNAATVRVAWDHLEPGSREFVRSGCEQQGFKLPY